MLVAQQSVREDHEPVEADEPDEPADAEDERDGDDRPEELCIHGASLARARTRRFMRMG
jgi:hypothetical protein